MRKWDINRTLSVTQSTPEAAAIYIDLFGQYIFPTADTLKIGKVLYRIRAHYDDTYDAIKPKIERLLLRELAQSQNTPEFANALCEFLCYTVSRKHCLSAARKEYLCHSQ